MKRTLSLAVAALVAALLPAAPAVAAPQIELLNPSPYTAGQVPELSSKEGRPVHLVAWTREAPTGALVEFEVSAVATTPPSFATATVDGFRVGSDTFEGPFTIPQNFPDGTYNVAVGLFSADGSEELGRDDQLVTINNQDVPPPPQSDNVEITQPANAAQAGFFTPQGAKRAHTVIQATASAGTDQVRVLYSMSDPGTQPEWRQCGSAAPGQGGFTVIRCTLAEGDSPLAVTAVAAVANQTPRQASPDPAADDAGDAHRVTPYLQTPAILAFEPEAVQQEVGKCQKLTITAFDQLSRPIAALNVDVHGTGPDDQLTFATLDTSPVTADTSNYQKPEKGHVSERATINCSDKSNSGKKQGLHRAIGAADRVHIESVSGTDNTGAFVVALFSPNPGGTQVSAWADVNDDDSQSLSEASGGARIGFGQAPPPARREIFIDPDGPSATAGECQSQTIVVREGGNASIGVNVDVHIKGPDGSVQFCQPLGASASARQPDSGEHVAGTHGDGTRHLEGETDSTGRFVYGVTSVSEGRTEVLGWIDETDDDTLTPAEPSAPASITFQAEGERSISLESSRSSVPRGRRVRLFGQIDGAASCSRGQVVKLKARTPGGRFKAIGRKTTDSNGEYAFRVRVRKTKDYKTIAPANMPCEKAKSRTVRVRAR
ncbi:MAG: hypothetical protein M3N53_05920 [Actinomycetota bacterium]|nr:hypothetical protein [Actinomycetota bacterium]